MLNIKREIEKALEKKDIVAVDVRVDKITFPTSLKIIKDTHNQFISGEKINVVGDADMTMLVVDNITHGFLTVYYIPEDTKDEEDVVTFVEENSQFFNPGVYYF